MAAPVQRRALWAEGLLLLLILLFCIFPFYWMVTTSLKTQVIALESPPVWVFTPTLANYWEVLFEDKVGISLINSIIVAVCTTTLAVVLARPPPMRWPALNSVASRTCGSGSSPTVSCRPSSSPSPSSSSAANLACATPTSR